MSDDDDDRLLDAAFEQHAGCRDDRSAATRQELRDAFFSGASVVLNLMLEPAGLTDTTKLLGALMAETGLHMGSISR